MKHNDSYETLKEHKKDLVPQGGSKAAAVYLLYWMSYDLDGNCIEGFERDDCSLIGVYSTRENAEAAMKRAKLLPGFKDYPDYFLIDCYELNEDHWTTGFTLI